MADLTAARSTKMKVSPLDMIPEFVMSTGATIYQGSGVAIGSDGKLVHASQAGALFTAGVAQSTVVSAAAGTTMRVQCGMAYFGNDAGHLLTIANRWDVCFWTDDQTVGSDSSKLAAGIVYDVDSVLGVCVIIFPGLAMQALSKADSPTFAGLNLGTGAIIGGLRPTAVKTANYTVVNGTDSDILLQSATDATQFTLPASTAANKGMLVTCQNTGAATAVEIQVLLASGTDAIQGTVGAVQASGTAGHGIKNTKATTKKGDFLSLQSDGNGTWWIVGGVGVWASL